MNHTAQNYFYVPPGDVYSGRFILKNDEFQHAAKVLRLKEGAMITAVDGEGNEILGEIRKITKEKEIHCSIVKKRRKPNEPILDVTLMQALIKGDRFDYLVEKAVEIGVNTIIPVHSERSIIAANTQKVWRWRRIAAAAMKQSHRSVLPEVTDIMEFLDALDHTSKVSEKILLCKDGKEQLSYYIESLRSKQIRRSIVIAVGPEGDFTQSELSAAYENSFAQFSLGPRRLRSETASIAGLSAFLIFDS